MLATAASHSLSASLMAAVDAHTGPQPPPYGYAPFFGAAASYNGAGYVVLLALTQWLQPHPHPQCGLRAPEGCRPESDPQLV